MENLLLISNDLTSLIRKARSGILKDELQALQSEIKLDDEELAFALQLENVLWKDSLHDGKLNLQISERALMLAQLYVNGFAIMGKEKFLHWMDKEHIAIGRIKPKEYLDTYFGIDFLLQELRRIEHGVLA